MQDAEEPTFEDLLTGEQPRVHVPAYPGQEIVLAKPGAPEPVPPPPAPVEVAYPVGTALDRAWARVPPLARGILGWVPVVLVMAIAVVTRLWHLGHPAELVFDETYYVKDGWAVWNIGYESTWPEDANARFAAGDTDRWTGDPSFAVHPPLGKWIIGLGMALVGPGDPTGWRIATAIAGILSVALIMIAAKRLTGRTTVAVVAGLFLAIDGSAIVMSRVGLLDGFLAFFALLAFTAIVLDHRWRPRLWRPWLLVAGIALGAAAAVKWSGLWFLAAYGIWTVVSDLVARHANGERNWFGRGLLRNAPLNFVYLVPTAIAVYVVSWAGWFASDDGYHRHWAEQGANAWEGSWSWVPRDLQSWFHLHQVTYEYHIGESRDHAYEVPSYLWLLLVRPTSMWWQSSAIGDPGCVTESCGATILDLANPLIWWASVAAIVYLVVRLIRRREWFVALVLVGFGAGYLPWLLYPERTVFQFYTIAFLPYLILALAIAVGAILGGPQDERTRRVNGMVTTTVLVLAAIGISVYFWPLWVGDVLDFGYLASHWWLPGWR